MGGIMSCLVAQAGFCVTSAACNVCCRSCGLSSSTATRIAYGVVFLIFTILAWVMLSPWAKDELSKVGRLTYGFSKADLTVMIGVMGVFRVCWAMATFFFFMSLVMIGVQNGNDPRRGLQNGWWAIKAGIILALLIGAFFIPNSFFSAWGVFGIVGSAVFILIQLVLLIDFAYYWQDYWVGKWEDSDHHGWFVLLLICTFGLLGFAVTMTVLMFVYYTSPGGCELSKFFISFNLILSVIVSVLSILPRIQEANPKTGLLQAACIVAYSTYLNFSAVSNLPHNECSQFNSSEGAMQTFINVVGGIFTFIAIAYSTIQTAEHSSMSALGMGGDDDDEPLLELGGSHTDEEGGDDESEACHYSWSFFHLTFALASLYVMMLLTNWGQLDTDDSSTYKVGTGWASVWVKVASSWVVLILYGWTTIAPLVFRDREFY